MGSEENKAAIRRFLDVVVNGHDLNALDQFVADDFVEHTPGPVETAGGREGLRQALAMLFAAFPDVASEEQDLIAEGNKVVYRGVFSGTHTGADYMGISASGKRFSMLEIHIGILEGGLQKEHWGLFDNIAMMQQLAMPAPGA